MVHFKILVQLTVLFHSPYCKIAQHGTLNTRLIETYSRNITLQIYMMSIKLHLMVCSSWHRAIFHCIKCIPHNARYKLNMQILYLTFCKSISINIYSTLIWKLTRKTIKSIALSIWSLGHKVIVTIYWYKSCVNCEIVVNLYFNFIIQFCSSM